MGDIIPINRGELRLQQAHDAAEARLREFVDCCDDYVLRWTVELLADTIWRLPFFAAGTRYEAECLRSLRYIAERFPMTPDNLKILLMMMDIVDGKYQAAFEGAA